MNRIKLGTAGFIAALAVITLLSVPIAPTYAKVTTVTVALRITWTSSDTQASVVIEDTPADITISVTNLSSNTYTFTGCKITEASPTEAALEGKFSCGVGTFTIAPSASTSFTGAITLGSGLGYPVDCPGGCNVAIAYVLTGHGIQSYPGYLIADLQAIG